MPETTGTDKQWEELAKQLCFKDEKSMYEAFYLEEQLSVSEIASRLECGTATVNRRMAYFEIPKRARGGARAQGVKRALLFYLDQRVVMGIGNKGLAELYGLSYSMVYGYKKWKTGGSATGYSLSTVGRRNGMEDIR